MFEIISVVFTLHPTLPHLQQRGLTQTPMRNETRDVGAERQFSRVNARRSISKLKHPKQKSENLDVIRKFVFELNEEKIVRLKKKLQCKFTQQAGQ